MLSLILHTYAANIEVTRWSRAEGLPWDSVTRIERYGDLLLIGSNTDLRWFDGEYFWPVLDSLGSADASENLTSLDWNPADSQPALFSQRQALLIEGGRVWVGASDGLYRFQKSPVLQEAPPAGFGRVDALFKDRDERVWQRVPGHGWWNPAAGWLSVTGIPPDKDLGQAALFQPPGESIWMAWDRVYASRSHDLPPDMSLVKDVPDIGMVRIAQVFHSGEVWLGGEQGAARWKDGQWSEVRTLENGTLGVVSAIESLPNREVLLIDNQGGLVITDKGKAYRLTSKDGLPSDKISFATYRDLFFLATEDKGLCSSFSEPTRMTITTEPWLCLGAAVLGSNDVRGVAVAANAYVWACSGSGISVVSIASLANKILLAQPNVEMLQFRLNRGVRGRVCPIPGQQLHYMGSQGEVGFPSTEGVLWIDAMNVKWPSHTKVRLMGVKTGDQWISPRKIDSLPSTTEAISLFASVPELGWGAVTSLEYRIQSGEWQPYSAGQALVINPETTPTVVEFRGSVLGGTVLPLRLSVVRQAFWYEQVIFKAIAVISLLSGGIALLYQQHRTHQLRTQALEKTVLERTEELRQRNALLQASAAELERRATELKAADQLKSEFIANVAHELRTPLMLVMGAMEDAQAAQTPADINRRLATALSNADRLSAILNSVLDLSRIESARFTLCARRRELGAVVAACVARFELAAIRTQIKLLFNSNEPVLCWVDADILEKILSNLLSNALSFAPAVRCVQVSVAKPDPESERVRICVDDDGPGIAEADWERVFDRFVQLGGGDSRRRGGVGIGLSLSRQLAELHGGSLKVRRASTGGASFYLELPLNSNFLRPEEIDLSSEVRSIPIALSAAEVGQPEILLVEDNDEMRAYLTEHLSEVYRLVPVASGREALAYAETRPPALLLSDIMMPEIDGFALCRAFMERPALTEIPRVLISAKAGSSVASSTRAVATAFLPKPFRMAQLFSLLSTLLPAVTECAPLIAQTTASMQPSELLEKLKKNADCHLTDENFGIPELARAAGMSVRTLQRVVTGTLGVPPVRWLKEHRLSRAMELMKEGKVKTVTDAATKVGMSRSHFIRSYSDWAGHAPNVDLFMEP